MRSSASGSAAPSCSSDPHGFAPDGPLAATTTKRASWRAWSRYGRWSCPRRCATASSARAAAAASWRPPTAARPTPAAVHRSQHRAAARAAAQPVHLARAGVRVPLLLHAQALVCTPRPRAGRVSRRLRHARRADGDPDADADREDRPADSGPALRFGLLERSDQLRGDGPARHDRPQGPLAVPLCR